MIVIDEEGVILSFSRTAEKMFGYSSIEMIGEMSAHEAVFEKLISETIQELNEFSIHTTVCRPPSDRQHESENQTLGNPQRFTHDRKRSSFDR